jgi:uncharacterized lipoprotein YehR (DUF1307 family)
MNISRRMHMKKIFTALLALMTVFSLAACGKTAETSATTTASGTTAKTEATTTTKAAVTTTAATTTAAAKSPATIEDFAAEHGITLETEYYFYGNENWGSIVFNEGGTAEYDIPNVSETSTKWSADEDGVYLANYSGEEIQLELFEDGDIFTVDTMTAAVSGYETDFSYTGAFKYDGDHDWLDIIEFYGGAEAAYKSLDEDGYETEQGTATVLAVDDKIIVTKNLYDEYGTPAFIYSEDGGETFEDDYYYYFAYDNEDIDSINSGWAEYAETLGDRSDYRDMAEDAGIEIDLKFYSDVDDSYLFISEDGLLYVYEPYSGATIPFKFDIDDSLITILNADGSVMSEIIFDGYEFTEPVTGTIYAP